jgi:ELWxxDGT repeat protein
MSVVLFSGYDANGNNALWVTDGTASGTHALSPIAGGYAGTTGIFPQSITAFGGLALFQGEDAAGVQGLWVTDGTAPGTHELTGIAGANSRGLFSFVLQDFNFAVLGSKALFAGFNAAQNIGLWVTDGTAAGTHQLTGISGAYASGLQPTGMTVLNNTILFSGISGFGMSGLWVSDGTSAGTHELTGIAGTNGLIPSDLTVFNGEVIFAGSGSNNQRSLWVTDGSSAGTHELTGISGAWTNGVFGVGRPAGITVFNDKVLFSGTAANSSQGLWVTDGTGAGTHELTGISDASGGGIFSAGQVPEFAVLGNEALFNGFDSSGRIGLWVTDGTGAGTHELTGISDASGGGIFGAGQVPEFAVLGNEALFNGFDSSGRIGLWVTDGTAGGTHELSITGAYPFTPGLFPNYLTVFTPITPPPGPNPPPPPGTTAAMVLRNGDGTYEIYDLGNNAILAGYQLGQVGVVWGFVTLAGFNGADTADMLLRNSVTGGFQVYDISNNNITNAAFLGNVGMDWQAMGFGNFSSRGETDMILRNTNTGVLEVYNISNNAITGAALMGTVGLDWQFSGIGNFSGAGESDMLLRNSNTGGLEVYDISSNQITGAALIGTVGLDWQFSGVGNFGGVPGETDLLLRNHTTGELEVYDINNNQLTGAALLGIVGLEWQFAGIAPVHGAGASDLVLRNVSTGAFEVYNIANNQVTGAAPLGTVGLDWRLGGFAASPPAGSMGSSDDSTSQLVQAMAGFGGGAAGASNIVPLGAEPSQQPFLTASHKM